ncbi:MAG: FKBP-type peptidyl-prolyl cis-trans isomerase [Gammaproteobacteria bacterium]|jgi:FKBP-type peptidyl-prolyl cis-trans isomerase FklB|nr:FKBP-type peptidyl-prolyl cis-trans isomerase [Gammaproteobacteria bacterium]
MNTKLYSGIICSLILLGGCTAEADEKLETTKDKASYTIGVQLGTQMAQTKDDINLDKVMMGLKDAFAGKEPRMKKEDMMAAMQAFQTEMQQKQQAKMTEMAGKNAKEGDAFLAENKKKEGVTTLPSGLQYKVITTGKGGSPKVSDTVVTHYRGSLIDGKVFDSSYERGEPVTFPVNGVIPGWTEALQKMKVGDKWQLVIPSSLAYGEHGSGPIGPNSVLIFDIELLEIKKSS